MKIIFIVFIILFFTLENHLIQSLRIPLLNELKKPTRSRAPLYNYKNSQYYVMIEIGMNHF